MREVLDISGPGSEDLNLTTTMGGVGGGSVSNHLSHSVLFDEMEMLDISRPGGEDLDLG